MIIVRISCLLIVLAALSAVMLTGCASAAAPTTVISVTPTNGALVTHTALPAPTATNMPATETNVSPPITATQVPPTATATLSPTNTAAPTRTAPPTPTLNLSTLPTQVSSRGIPMTGLEVPSMSSFDRHILDLMAKWNLPGGAIAVVKNGRLILARGYGYADKEKREAVQPDSLFRIASVTKPFTAVAIMELVQENKLSLDAKAMPLLDNLPGHVGTTPDSRLDQITIRDLLEHAGGWDADKSFDPMFNPGRAAQVLGVPAPADASTIIRYMKGQPLQFQPGTQYVYSNFGYDILGRIIEKVSGQSYRDYVTEHVLKPVGITRMRLAGSRLQDRAPGEVRYYDYPGAPLVQSVFPNEGMVPAPYGGFYIEAMDSHGGWIASPIDVLRFADAVDGRNRQPGLLNPAMINTMIARPQAPLWVGSPYYYALGWNVRPAEADSNWWHNGSLPGTTSLLVRAANGLSWFAVFNSRSQNWDALDTDLDNTIWQAVNEVNDWPSHDLFGQYQSNPTNGK